MTTAINAGWEPGVPAETKRQLAALQQALADQTRRADSAELQLRRMREAVDAIPEGLALLDRQDRFLYWNGAYAQMYAAAGDCLQVGASFRSVMKQLSATDACRDASGEREISLHETSMKERLRRHDLQTDKVEQLMANGSTILVAERSTSDGGAVSLHIDITELKQRENALTLFLENNPIPAYLVDRQTYRFLMVNQAAVDFYGYSRERFLTLSSLDIRPPEDHAAFRAAFAEPEATMRNGGFFRHRKADGEIVEVAIHARAVDFGERHGMLVAVIDLSQKRAQEARVAHLAHHDALTGLPNRLAFQEQLAGCEAAAETGRPFAAICVDLEGFKAINEHFGQGAGDILLQQAAARFAEAAAPDFVARVASDEFVVLLDDCGDDRRETVANALLRAARRDFDLGPVRVAPGASMGVAAFPGGGQAFELHAQARAALAHAKATTPGAICTYNSALGAAIQERQQLTLELKTALAQGEFEIWLQPQADLSGAVFAFEALTRWRHPRRGLIPPSVFIPLAEESGMIIELDTWVLRACCREAALWRRDLRIAVNLSALHFADETMVGRIRDILRETGLPPGRLELEVTESVLVADAAAAAGLLRRLKALGISVALDDFGAGYSSLSYLQSLPFDRLKIDRSFVHRLKRGGKSQAIVRAIVELGRGLDLSVIAEGVETRAQLAILREIGCSQFQGFLIGRPSPLADCMGQTRAA